MGGNIFKNGSTRRMTAAEFESTRALFTSQLKMAHPQVHFEVLQAYGDKPDFGNLSVFVHSDGPTTDQEVFSFLKDAADGAPVIQAS